MSQNRHTGGFRGIIPSELPVGNRREQDGAGRRTLAFIRLGYVIPLVFWSTTFLCGFILGDYDHLTRMVSELGAIGTRTQFIFSAGLLLCSVLSVLFIVALRRACKKIGVSAVPVMILLAYTVSIAGAGVFPLPMRLHLLAGLPSILLILSPLLALFLWYGSTRLSAMMPYAVISFCVMNLGFLAFMPEVLSGYPGLKQRLFHVGWSIWFYVLSQRFYRLMEDEK